MDEDVQYYLDLLKEEYYNDGSIQRDGHYVLQEMITIAKALVKSKKSQVENNLNFINIRGNQLSYLLDELKGYTNSIALKSKYTIFWSNAQALSEQSETMDDINAKINFTVATALTKLQSYEREYTRVIKQITVLSELSAFYDTADETLTEIEDMLEV